MSKDVRRLFAAQKAAKAGPSGSGSGPGSGSSSLSSSKRVTHPLAKYDPKTLRLTCAICGPTVPIKSDNLWNAHLVSKAHQEAVGKLRAVKEQMQKREAETAERVRLQQQQQQQQQQQNSSTQAQGVKRKAPGGLVAYAADSESESDDDNDGDNQIGHDQKASSNKQQPMSESKRVKLEDEMMDQDEEERQRRQAVADIEEEEHAMTGLPAGFFDSGVAPSNDQEDDTREAPSSTEESTTAMDGVLPAGFFDDPEIEARVRAEVGGATTDQLERQVEEELKALQAELAQDLEDEVENRGQTTAGRASAQGSNNTINGSQATSNPNSEYIPYEEKVEQEEEELEESMLARMEEEYQLFVEMQTRVDGLREKKNRLLAPHSSSDSSSSVVPPTPTLPDAKGQPGKQKKKSILELVREQERAKKEKERLAAKEYNRVRATVENDSKMASSDDESEEEDDEEDIEAMMDWRAKRF
ncbi:MAG: hypothetical protein J3Q66DRAFT_342016 [Benniella sp.]|nr:MAG: hypothetical protein J3Q66DRAFT_342016 [Benniella sp.]